MAAGEKLAVCGPSGSGKTSLILALLQMIEVTEGKIVVDGVDLGTLEGADTRGRINVIPQDPFFMPGTVRFNLDPRQQASEEEVKSALEKVGLLERISGSGGLEKSLAAGEFSIGEKRLLALARAILSKSQILVLDEAMSRYDSLSCLPPLLPLPPFSFSFTCSLLKVSID